MKLAVVCMTPHLKGGTVDNELLRHTLFESYETQKQKYKNKNEEIF